MRACVIIGDIVKSQKLDNLPAVMSTLKATLEQINTDLGDEALGPLAIFAGDSFEGALRTPRYAYDIFRTIRLAIRPATIRCVAAVGEIDSLAGGNALEMTGPVFATASDALAELGKARQRIRRRFRLISGDDATDQLVSATVDLVEAVRSRWSERHVRLAELIEDHSVEDTAHELGISRISVNKLLASGAFDELVEAERAIREQLGHLGGSC
jgi:hypothetical protein